MKKILVVGSLALMLILPAVSSAALYHYLDLTGRVTTIQVSNAPAALAVADQANRGIVKSGVKLDQGARETLKTGQWFGTFYQYMSVSGAIKSVMAASAEAAFALAADIAPTSGFLMLDVAS